MHLDDLRAFCLALPETAEDTPFGPDTLAFKVSGKMFALAGLDEIPPRVNLKCDPERAVELREQHEAVLPGYHMNKRHWNTVVLDHSLPSALVRSMVEDSYRLVVAGLREGDRERITQRLEQRAVGRSEP